MEHKFTTLSNEEILNLNSQQLKEFIDEIRDSYDKLNAMSYEIVSKKMAELVCGYDIENVGINPHYEYNDEGFAGNYMVTIDYEDVCYNDEDVPRYSKNAKKITYSNLQTKIDSEMAEIRFLINEDMGFDVKKLRVKYRYAEMEKELSQKTDSKVSSRYKL